MHLVGFIIEMYYDAQPYERQIKEFYYTYYYYYCAGFLWR